MKIKLVKKDINVVEHKRCIYNNGIVCNYKLENGILISVEMYRNKELLPFLMNENVNAQDIVWNDYGKHLQNVKDIIKNEQDIIDFEDKLSRLCCIKYYILHDVDLEPLPIQIHLYNIGCAFVNRNDDANIRIVANWLKNHDDIDVIDLKIDDVPHYNCREFEEDEDEYAEKDITVFIRFKHKDLILKRLANYSKNAYFSPSDYTGQLAKEFCEQYPELKREW